MDKGQWLFTCAMQPKQFSHYEDASQRDFIAIDGSAHSVKHCSLKVISDTYAKFFNKHKLWELYKEEDGFDIYINKVKEFCKEHNIKFEGI